MRRPLLGFMLAGIWLGQSACQTGDRSLPAHGWTVGSAPLLASAKGNAPSPATHPGVRFHTKPKPLPPGAVTHDWTSFLGPSHNGVSTETRLLKDWPEGGPPLVWELAKGTGYTSPAIHGSRLVYFYRQGQERNRRLPAPRNRTTLLDLSLPDRLQRPIRLQQRAPLQPGDRRQPGLHLRRRRPAPFPRSEIRSGPLETALVAGVPCAPGFLRGCLHTPGRRKSTDCQRGRPWRAFRNRSGQGHRQAGVGSRRPMGSQLRVPGTGHGERQEAHLRLRRGRKSPAHRGAVEHRSRQRENRLPLSLEKPQLRVGQCFQPCCNRQPGADLGQLQDGSGAARPSPRQHPPIGLDRTPLRPALEHGHTPGGLPLRVRRPQ